MSGVAGEPGLMNLTFLARVAEVFWTKTASQPTLCVDSESASQRDGAQCIYNSGLGDLPEPIPVLIPMATDSIALWQSSRGILSAL